jgi:hypothetical protein
MRYVYLRRLAGACLFTASLGATTIPLIIPIGSQGAGYFNLYIDSEGPGTNTCQSTTSGGPDNCTLSNTSAIASAGGTLLAYMDSAGMHVSADVATSGGGVAEGEAVSWYTDTITNNSTKTAQVDLSFTVDGILAVSNFDRSQLEIGVFQGANICLLSDYNSCGYLNTPIKDWLYNENSNSSLPISQTLLTPVFTIAPGNSYTFTVDLDALSTSYHGGVANADVQNTLSFTGFTATDGLGNAISASQFSSADGANYSSIDTTAAPEPAGFLLLGSGLTALGLWRRRSGVAVSVAKTNFTEINAQGATATTATTASGHERLNND